MRLQEVPHINYSLLKALEEIHLGKSTSMGLGQIKVLYKNKNREEI